MKTPYLILIIVLFVTSGSQCKNKKNQSHDYPFYIGTYTRDGSEGIYRSVLNEDGSFLSLQLAAKSSNPSYLTWGPKKNSLLAVNELPQKKGGAVVSYRINKEGLKEVNSTPSGGAGACFVACNNDGYVVNANYGSGSIGLHRLDDKGKLSNLLDKHQHEGKGAHTSRQKGPHAHSAWFVPNSNDVIAVDLGTDDLWLYTLDRNKNKLIPKEQKTLKMNPGDGPRHLCFHPNGKWIYLLNELSCTVTQVLFTADGTYKKGNSVSTLPEDYSEANTCAHIVATSDGRFIYASNRGHNSLVIYNVNPKDGSLCLVEHQSVHGDWPRNFALSPDEKFIVVANQRSNNITSFKRNSKTGKLNYNDEVKAPIPVCILFE